LPAATRGRHASKLLAWEIEARQRSASIVETSELDGEIRPLRDLRDTDRPAEPEVSCCCRSSITALRPGALDERQRWEPLDETLAGGSVRRRRRRPLGRLCAVDALSLPTDGRRLTSGAATRRVGKPLLAQVKADFR
jgi:hypothetical protein